MIELLYERRSLENPSTPLDPDYDSGWYGAESSSGIRISREKALTYSAVWRAVTLISSTVAKLPLHIYKRTGQGKERAVNHPAYKLVRFNPNAEMNAFVFWQTLMGHVLLDGNAYAYIFRSGDAAPLELIPLAPSDTYPVRENGNLLYVTKAGTEWRRLLPENVLHIKGLGYDGLCGYSVIAKARDSFGLGIGARRYQEVYLRNNARPSAIIELPGTMQPPAQQELLRQWNEMHQGLDNAHRTAILTNGAKLNAYSINARDSQLLETRQFEIREIANWFGLPPHKLGDSSRTAYNSLEQENQSFLDDTLDPWLVAIEQECRDKLLTEREKQADSHIVEFLRQALIRADIVARYTAYNIGKTGGWLNDDNIAAAENMNALPNGLGQQYWAPLNMAIRKPDGEEPQEPPDAQQLLTITQAVVADQIPPAAATVIIQQAFPAMPPADVAKLVTAATAFEPDPEPTGSAIGDDEPPEDEPLPEDPPDDGEEPTDRSTVTQNIFSPTIVLPRQEERSSDVQGDGKTTEPDQPAPTLEPISRREEMAEALRPVIEGAFARHVKRMSKTIVDAARKPRKADPGKPFVDTPSATFAGVVEKTFMEFDDILCDESVPLRRACIAAGCNESDVSEFINESLTVLSEDLERLFKVVPDGEDGGMVAAIESRMANFSDAMPKLIANRLLGEKVA